MILEGKEYLRDAKGSLVPKEKVKKIDLLRDSLVREMAQKVQAMSEELSRLKRELFQDFDSFCDLSLERYGIRQGGRKGNISLTSYDGEYRVDMAVQDVLAFDEQLEAAKELIDRCIHRWSLGANDNLRALVNNAFKVDKKGNVDTRRILELRRLDIVDEEWQRAMDAIGDSIKILISRRYIRVYRRDGEGYQMIPLDFAAL